MCVSLQDQYSNAAGEGLDGEVIVTVKGTGDPLPLFENEDTSVTHSLTNGQTLITVSVCSFNLVCVRVMCDPGAQKQS